MSLTATLTANSSRSRSAAGKCVWLLVDSSSIGGIERHIAVLAQSLPKFGVSARVVLYGDHGANPWLGQLRDGHVPHDVLAGTPISLLHALRGGRPDLLHTHGYKAGLMGRLAAGALGIPVVSTYHAGERAPWPVSAYQRLDELSGFLSARISVSAPIASRLPFGSVTIPNFVDVPAAPPAEMLPARIAFVGRFSHEKGPDLFCELAERAGSGFEWSMFGDGPMRADLESRYSGLIRFHGLVQDMSSVWPGVGLLAMPSRAEGLPLAALEALSHGVPVLASRVGALPDVIRPGENGWLFSSHDLAGAADGVAAWNAARESNGAALRASAWKTASERFSASARAAEVVEVYESSWR